MSARFGSMADEFYASTRLFMKMDMSLDRESVLHFFDQVRKAFPSMDRFHRRNDGGLILEEQPAVGQSRRWLRLERDSVRFGYFAPPPDQDLRDLANVIVEQAPYHLTFSDLDFDHVEVVYGFDLEYRGNHDQLIAESLWADHPLGGFLLDPDARHVIDAQPFLGIALSPECDLQAYIEVKSRTGTYEVRTGEYEAQPLSVILTVRKYWGIGSKEALPSVYNRLFDIADELTAGKLVPLLVNPIAQAIASRS